MGLVTMKLRPYMGDVLVEGPTKAVFGPKTALNKKTLH